MNESAEKLCGIYRELQKNVKRFENDINNGSTVSDLCNGLNGNRIKIGLMGHYSTGKTTLLSRIFGGYAGAISSVPETACLVVHRLDSFQGISIKFKSEFRIEKDKEDSFKAFLEENKLEKYIQQSGMNTWKSNQQEEISPDYKVIDTKRFLENVNDYMNVIEKIYWCHKRGREDENALDFLEIYDLPGFGGTDAHEDVISSIIKTESFNIVIYLIDPSQGIPKDSDIQRLQILSPLLETSNEDILFYWAYEKPIGTFDRQKKLDEIRSAINGSLSQTFYKNARLLDITGEKDDAETPQNVFSLEVLPLYFQMAGARYLKSQSDFWNRDKEKIPVFALQPILTQIDDESRKNEVSKECVTAIFEEKLELDSGFLKEKRFQEKLSEIKEKIHKKLAERKSSPRLEEFSEEEQRMLQIEALQEEIQKTVKEMINFVCHGPLHPTADINKVRTPFWKKYYASREWQLLLQNLCDYKVKVNYNSVRQHNLANIGTEIFNDIKRSINTIERHIQEIAPQSAPFSWESQGKDFANVKPNDTALSVISAEDLSVIRTDLPVAATDSKALMTNYLSSLANEMDKNQTDAERAVDAASEQFEKALKASENLDDELSNLGM